ncbi:hypothetical protein A4A49_22601 [Nicotiana attenuata]|uniref:Uncharacterized protein n=1 Tax=Nicotiana attenuata TaxID=49451 RepID=A0A314KJ10_NICAT|nr:hypothetical protein A4A49_22601 [Nicotiana attenuata]
MQMWLQNWSPYFKPEEDLPIAPAWVLLPGLPFHMHDWHYIKQLLRFVGTPLALDAATLGRTRPSMAKIRVEVDLLKSLPDSVFVGQEDDESPLKGYTQKLEYEGVPKYCKHCRKLGHNMINSRALEKKYVASSEEKQNPTKETTQNKQDEERGTRNGSIKLNETIDTLVKSGKEKEDALIGQSQKISKAQVIKNSKEKGKIQESEENNNTFTLKELEKPHETQNQHQVKQRNNEKKSGKKKPKKMPKKKNKEHLRLSPESTKRNKRRKELTMVTTLRRPREMGRVPNFQSQTRMITKKK